MFASIGQPVRRLSDENEAGSMDRRTEDVEKQKRRDVNE